MSRHQTYDDMLEQLDRFIESLDSKAPGPPADKNVEETAAEEKPLYPEVFEREALIRFKIPA
jgi:hypothetical protein